MSRGVGILERRLRTGLGVKRMGYDFRNDGLRRGAQG